jgi:hypothetical protein
MEASPRQNASVRLNVVNCDKDNLGMPLPAGMVKVYQFNSTKNLQLVGTATISHIAKDEAFQLNIGTTSDIKAQTKMTAAKAVPATIATPKTNQYVPEYQDQTFEVTVWNFKEKKDVAVVLELNVPRNQPDVQPLIRDSAERAHAKIDAAAGKSGTFSYTLRVQTN